ncbi:hypothetical protein E2C01_038532 [Portunus trituberculatus]|uniref:Uncharacterized protein n=1 Tax=Portunus trituberculatus TaxID=210409 RepID=A0A5B7FCG7_PORTR|nr:hypothetical protein [Portunus trituberculatus]
MATSTAWPHPPFYHSTTIVYPPLPRNLSLKYPHYPHSSHDPTYLIPPGLFTLLPLPSRAWRTGCG